MFQYQVCICSAKAKGTDRGALTIPAVWPIDRLPDNLPLTDQIILRSVRFPYFDGGGQTIIRHTQDHLEHAAHAGGSQQMPKVRFDRANQRSSLMRSEERFHRVQLGDIAKRRASGVTFNIVNIFGRKIGCCVGALESQPLPLRIGCEQMLALAVIR